MLFCIVLMPMLVQSNSEVFLRKQGNSPVVPDPDVVAGLGVGVPGDVEPAGAGEELVGVRVHPEERYE